MKEIILEVPDDFDIDNECPNKGSCEAECSCDECWIGMLIKLVYNALHKEVINE